MSVSNNCRRLFFFKLAVAGHLVLFVARTRHFFLSRPFPAPLLLTTIVGTQIVAALIAGFGWFVTPRSWRYIGLIWAYCLFWVFIEEGLKLWVYRHLEHKTSRRSHFLTRLKGTLHAHSRNAEPDSYPFMPKHLFATGFFHRSAP
ncbi:MAG: hypothetical protein ACU83N_11990 [Gammaproteobacteria bacterium]